MWEEIDRSSAKSVIDNCIVHNEKSIAEAISKYDPIDAFYRWRNSIRATEELINALMFGNIETQQRQALLEIKLDQTFIVREIATHSVQNLLSELFNDGLAGRVSLLLIDLVGVKFGFNSQGYNFEGGNLETVGDALRFLQSRRRHFISFLYIIPVVCSGSLSVPKDFFLEVMPIIEFACISIVSSARQLVLADVFDDFKLMSDGSVFRGNYDLQPLEEYSLEPERLSLVDIVEFKQDSVEFPQQDAIDLHKIFSVAEFKNSLRLLDSVCMQFGLSDTVFPVVSGIVCCFLSNCEQDYYISVDRTAFEKVLYDHDKIDVEKLKKILIYSGKSYIEAIDAVQPFVLVGDRVESNLFLLLRFLYYLKNACLNKNKTFQIRSGFIFEAKLKQKLEGAGFVVTNIKRINRKEFDVVALKNNEIHNFQCKNNMVDISKIVSNRCLFVRHNRKLVKYYQISLQKEKMREKLLLDKLKMTKITHYVISRFPVFTSDDRIISFNALDRFFV